MPNTLKDVLIWSNTVQVLEAEKVVTKWVAFSTPSEMPMATFRSVMGTGGGNMAFQLSEAILAEGQLGPFRLTVKQSQQGMSKTYRRLCFRLARS